ncbi:hypothetical protein PCYB_081420, partial [Plasmodium cynomolgi strain B]
MQRALFSNARIYHFLKVERRHGGTSLLTKIGQSFNQESLRNAKIKLTNYGKSISPNQLGKTNSSTGGASGGSGIFQHFIDIFKKKTNVKDSPQSSDKNEKKEKEFFEYYIKCLMKYEGIFTYRKFQSKDLCDYFNVFGLTYKYKKKMNPQLEKLKKQYEVMNSFLPYELDSDDCKIFHEESKKYIAQSCNVDVNFIDELLLFHDS